jgi:hypothetical protein
LHPAIQIVEGDGALAGGDSGFGCSARQLHLQIRHAIAALDNQVHCIGALFCDAYAEAVGQQPRLGFTRGLHAYLQGI